MHEASNDITHTRAQNAMNEMEFVMNLPTFTHIFFMFKRSANCIKDLAKGPSLYYVSISMDYVSIKIVLIVIKNDHFPTPPTQSFC